MLRHFRRALLLMTAAVCLSAPAVLAAGPPDPGTSTVQDCLVTCPSGEMTFQVTVRDNTGAPCAGVAVAIDFCPCTEAMLCLQAGGDPCANGKNDLLVQYTNASGAVVFYPASGGTCDGVPVEIVADGIVLAQRYVRAMDADGDFVVDADDFTFDNIANDYNCDGVSNIADLATFNTHFGHTCDAPIGDEQQSWGKVKSFWR